MTRTTTAIMMIFWLLCQQAVAGVVTYKMFPLIPVEHGEKNAIHCQESPDNGIQYRTTENESLPSVFANVSAHQHDSTPDCCERDCQRCVAGCTIHFALSALAPHVKTITHSPVLYFTNAALVPGIHSLFRPPILS